MSDFRHPSGFSTHLDAFVALIPEHPASVCRLIDRQAVGNHKRRIDFALFDPA